MPALGEAHAHDGVAGLEKGEKHGLIGLRARMRLHVGGIGAIKAAQPVDGELLGHVDILAATVVATTGIAFRVFVGELAALRRHHGRAGVILRGNQLDVRFLSLIFLADGIPELGIDAVDPDRAVKHGRLLRERRVKQPF
jgi:hypothetical protein